MMNPGPNNRALTTGGDDPKGGAILKITFAGLLSCSGENKLPKCALPHRPNSPGRATLLQRTVDLTLTPRLFRTNSVRGPKCPVPPWSRTVGEPRYTARLFHFKLMDLHLTEFQ
jgi:hypothetical protein